MFLALTGISLPIKVVLWIAMALQIQPCLLASRAVRERDVVIRDIVEEMDLFFLQEKTGSDRMNRGISPTFVEEPSILVESFKVI
jgi:hypothetical protein